MEPGASPSSIPAPPPAPVEIGALVGGKYRVVKVLAHGGMGVVYEALHIQLEQRVAIKFMRPEIAAEPHLVARFIEEARSAAVLKSPHIVRIIDIGQLPTGIAYTVMEHLDGVDLASVIDGEGPLPVERAVDYALQVCEALSEAHAAGIVHRDIKPENLVVCGKRSTLKVVDFGIAKRMGVRRRRALTGIGDVMGSPWYMAPEQLAAPDSVDPRADIWAVGVVLYELLTARRPFNGENTAAICDEVLNRAPVPPSAHRRGIHAALDRVVLRCLQKDPNARFQSVENLASLLACFAPRATSHRFIARSHLDLNDVMDRIDTIVAPASVSQSAEGEGSTPPPVAATIGDSEPPPAVVPRRRRPILIAAAICSAALLVPFARWHDVPGARQLASAYLGIDVGGAALVLPERETRWSGSPPEWAAPAMHGPMDVPSSFSTLAGARAERELESVDVDELKAAKKSKKAKRKRDRARRAAMADLERAIEASVGEVPEPETDPVRPEPPTPASEQAAEAAPPPADSAE